MVVVSGLAEGSVVTLGVTDGGELGSGVVDGVALAGRRIVAVGTDDARD